MQSIGSRDNPLVKRARALAASARECRKRGETVLDGPHLVAAAIAGGVPLKAVLCSESGLRSGEIARLAEACGERGSAVLPDALFAQISPVDSPTGILAIIDIPVSGGASVTGTVVVLEAVQDAGNLGSILRTAAAAGLGQAVLTPGCAQAWSPRALRAGMGAQFSLDIFESADPAALLADYRGIVLATSPDDSARSIFDCDLRGDVAWLIGSEGAGLSTALAGLAARRVRVPMPGSAESLNVAAATAVCLFEQVRQKRA